MSGLRITVIPFTWRTIAVEFSEGTAFAVDLADSIDNPDGYPITYAVVGSLPSGVTLAGSQLAYNGAGAAGQRSVVFTATMGSLVATSEISTVAVVDVNVVPRWAGAPSTLSFTAGIGGTYNFAQHASDPDGDTLTYSVSPTNTGITMPNGVLTVTPTATAAIRNLTIRVTDPGGLFADHPCAVTVSGDVGTLLFSDGFETGSLDLTKWVRDVDGDGTLTVQNTIKREGTYALRSYVSRNTIADRRTEVRARATAAEDVSRFFKDTWYGFSVYLEPPYTSSGLWEIVAQWHGYQKFAGTPDEFDTVNNPPLSFGPQNGYHRLIGNYGWNQPTTSGGSAFDLAQWIPVVTGRWQDFVFRVRWDYRRTQDGGAGQCQAWVDGVQKLNYAGPIGYNDYKAPYFKMGLYTATTVGPSRVLYHDCLRIGDENSTYATVVPR